MSLEFLLIPEVVDTAMGFAVGTGAGYAFGAKESSMELQEEIVRIAGEEELANLVSRLTRRLESYEWKGALLGGGPAAAHNIMFHSTPAQFTRGCGLGLLAGVAGLKLGKYLGKRKHRKIRQNIDAITEKVRQMMIDREDNLKIHEAFGKPTWDQANKSRYHELYKAYSLAKFKQAAEYSHAYREVKDFMLVVPTPFFGAAVIGDPKYPRCYVILMEEGNITTANAGIENLKAIRNDEFSVTCISPKVELENTVEWGSTPEPVVDLIMANRKERVTVLAGGAEYMPREERLASAAASFANIHYLWTQKQGEGNGGNPNAS